MIPTAFVSLASHLWQSTLFAILAALLSLAMRRHQARIRYGLWLAASYKFLIPFVWLVSLGHRLHWGATSAVMPPTLSTVTDMVSGPIFLRPLSTAKLPVVHPSVLPMVILAVWSLGFLVAISAWAREWMQIRAIVRAAKPLPLGLPIPALSSPARFEPGVFGIFHPVLILPEGIGGRLTPAQWQGILAHEMCHVSRRDNLTAAVHMLVEALFWFHPLVWWLGARMIDERERACDEEVLRLGGAPEAYAEGILNVCKSYVESPMACLSGISGSDLRKRIVRIMTRRFPEKLSLARKLVLAGVGVGVLAGPLGFGLVNATQILRQAAAQWQVTAGGARAFDVISVKPSASRIRIFSNVGLSGLDDGTPDGGLLSAVGFRLTAYIGFAYKLTPYQTNFLDPQLPTWAKTKFDIEARVAGNPTKDQMRLMMQSLLADRFKLATHFETRELPVFALSLAEPGKTGPKLQPHSDPPCSDTPIPRPSPVSEPTPLTKVGGFSVRCGTLLAFDLPHNAPTHLQIEGRNLTMGQIANYLVSIGHFDREVLDSTGLNGNFDFSIQFTPDANALRPGHFHPDPSGTKIAEALEKQLGLRLDPQTGLVNVLMIDHVEEPSAN